VLAFIDAGGGGRAATLANLANVLGGSAEAEEGLENLARIGGALDALGVSEALASFDPSVVRGLEYYTGAVFEAETRAPGAPSFGSIGGGGRYDGLVARFIGEAAPAVGFSFGVSRLAAILAAQGESPERRGPVVVIAFSEANMPAYLAAAAELRAAGIPAEVYLGASGMRAQMKYADRRAAPATVIIGDEELAADQVTIKDLALGETLAAGVSDYQAWREARPGQVTVPRAELVAAVRKIMDARA
jgi:histidyl-tRNA synthetase